MLEWKFPLSIYVVNNFFYGEYGFINDALGYLRYVNLTFPRKDVVTAKIETSFPLERNDPLGPVDDGGPRGTKPRRLSDVHFIDAAQSGGL